MELENLHTKLKWIEYRVRIWLKILDHIFSLFPYFLHSWILPSKEEGREIGEKSRAKTSSIELPNKSILCFFGWAVDWEEFININGTHLKTFVQTDSFNYREVLVFQPTLEANIYRNLTPQGLCQRKFEAIGIPISRERRSRTSTTR